METEKIQNIYHTLIGTIQEEYCVPGVEYLFAEGCECEQLYCQMHEAYARLRDRLGVAGEDKDVEIIIDSLMRIENKVSIKMFEYGMRFAKN